MSRGTSLLRNEFVELEIYYTEKVVLVRRTTTAFARVADVEATIEAVAKALPLERRAGYSLLVDGRSSPVRTEPSLDPVFARYRAEVERGFERAVVVVATVVGKIRSDRLAQSAQLPMTVVESIDEAWTMLRTRS